MLNTVRLQEVGGTVLWIASAITVTEFTWEAFTATYQKPAEPGSNIALDAVAAAAAAKIASKAIPSPVKKAGKSTVSKVFNFLKNKVLGTAVKGAEGAVVGGVTGAAGATTAAGPEAAPIGGAAGGILGAAKSILSNIFK